MASDKKIQGAVSVGSKTYVAGQEEAFADAVKAAEKDEKTRVDVDALESRGVVVGFGKRVSDVNSLTLNRQLDADGDLADPESEEKAAQILEESGAIRNVDAVAAPESGAAAGSEQPVKTSARKAGRSRGGR